VTLFTQSSVGFALLRAESSDDAQEFARPLQFWKALFFCQKFARMHASPAPSQFDRVLQMQHLVEEDVFDGVARHTRMVEDAADDDGIVRRVVVAEAAAGVVPAPGELRAAHEPVEEAAVEVFENFFQMVVMAAGGADVLASAHLADEARLGGNVVAGDVAAITGAVGTIDRLAIKLGEQDVGNRVQHGFGSAFKQVGEADVELSLAEADGVVDGDESVETNVHGRRGREGTEFAIRFVKDFGELWGHVEGRVAEAAISRQLSVKQT
jgi:hypothetical protein